MEEGGNVIEIEMGGILLTAGWNQESIIITAASRLTGQCRLKRVVTGLNWIGILWAQFLVGGAGFCRKRTEVRILDTRCPAGERVPFEAAAA